MAPEEMDQVKDLVNKSVTAAMSVVVAQLKPASPVPNGRSSAEIGSPEFAEDRTQVNSLNNKFLFDAHLLQSLVINGHNQTHFDDLNHRSLKSIDGLIDLQTKVNAKFFDGVDDRARIRDQWNYVTAYDLSNPNTLGTSDNIRGGATPAGRAIDAGTAQSVLNSTTMQAAIQAAVADAINGTVPTLEAAIGAAVAEALATAPKPVAPTAGA